MRLLRQKKFLVPILTIMMVLAFTVGVLAAVQWNTNVNGQFTVQAVPSYDLELYTDVGLQNPVGQLDWGTLYQGESADTTIYVKNVGNQTVYVTVSSSLNPDVGSITRTPAPLSITAGNSAAMTLTLTLEEDAATGYYNPVTVTINSNDV